MASKTPVSEVRAWAKQQGFALADRGRLPAEVWAAWDTNSKTAGKRNRSITKVEQPAAAAAVPAQRSVDTDDPARHEDVTALTEALSAALTRIEQLEQQVSRLTSDLSALKQQPRRRFARSRNAATGAG
jgi:hypothetical protein